MTLFQLLLFVHIMAAVIWIGGAFVGSLVGSFIARTGEDASMATYCRAFASIAGPWFGGSGLLVMATGVWMVIDAPGLEFSALWISIGFTGWLVSMIFGATAVGQTWTKIGRELDAGSTIEAQRPRLRKAVMYTHLDVLLRVAVVLVMVWRPT